MLPKSVIILIFGTIISFASQTLVIGANSGYMTIYDTQIEGGNEISGSATSMLISGLIEYDFIDYIGVRLEIGGANAKQSGTVPYNNNWQQTEATFAYKPYFCMGIPFHFPVFEWNSGFRKNILSLYGVPSLTSSTFTAQRKLQRWDDSHQQYYYNPLGYESRTADLTAIVGVRCKLVNGLCFWSEFKAWGEHLEVPKDSLQSVRESEDVTVHTIGIGAGYSFL